MTSIIVPTSLNDSEHCQRCDIEMISSSATDKQETIVNIDQLLERWCGNGLWQKTLLSCSSLVYLTLPLFSMSIMFIGATPDFKCSDEFPINASYFDLLVSNVSSRCLAPDGISPCSRWVFDNTTYISTIVTQWSLVCSHKPMVAMMQALLMLGGMAGSLVASQLGDIIGRKPVLLSAVLIFVSMAFTAALTSNFSLFAISRFFTGIGMAMMIEGQTVIITELVMPEKRTTYMFLMIATFPLGVISLSIIVYFVRNHCTSQLIFACISLVLFSNFWIVPESPRWLILKNRLPEACKVLSNGARRNGKYAHFDKDLVLTQMKQIQQQSKSANGTTGSRSLAKMWSNLTELFSTSKMWSIMSINAFLQFVVCSAYFGISFDQTQLSSNPFLAAALTGLVELPFHFLYPIVNRIGRVPASVASLLTTAVSMLMLFTSDNSTLWLIMGLISKMAVTIAFAVVVIHTLECLPTSVRALGSALTQMALRLGGASAFFVVDLLTQLHPAAPSGVFGVLTLLAGLLSFLLPETVNKTLPDTVQHVHALYHKPAAVQIVHDDE